MSGLFQQPACRERRVDGAAPAAAEEHEMSLTVTVKEHGVGLFTVSPIGSLDSNTFQILEDRLQPITAASPRTIIFDLKDLSYISSAGVRVILVTKKALKAAGGDIALTNLQPQIRKVFDIIKAVPSLSIFESVEELDRYLDAMQKKVKEGDA
jgi:anti-anti-sigma factor